MAAPSRRRKPRAASFDTTTCFATIHGHRRAYRMRGFGLALLLIHGIGDSSASWVPLMRPLAERYTVIAPDLLGHGESDKPRRLLGRRFANGMRDLLDVLGIDKATVVGHSLGGGVAAQLTYQHPTRVNRLALRRAAVSRGGEPFLRAASTPPADSGPAVPAVPAGAVARGRYRAVRRSGTDLAGCEEPRADLRRTWRRAARSPAPCAPWSNGGARW
ncbi:MAG: alpha/beta hydrolase [Acidimicrobiales bacterium]